MEAYPTRGVPGRQLTFVTLRYPAAVLEAVKRAKSMRCVGEMHLRVASLSLREVEVASLWLSSDLESLPTECDLSELSRTPSPGQNLCLVLVVIH